MVMCSWRDVKSVKGEGMEAVFFVDIICFSLSLYSGSMYVRMWFPQWVSSPQGVGAKGAGPEGGVGGDCGTRCWTGKTSYR